MEHKVIITDKQFKRLKKDANGRNVIKFRKFWKKTIEEKLQAITKQFDRSIVKIKHLDFIPNEWTETCWYIHKVVIDDTGEFYFIGHDLEGDFTTREEYFDHHRVNPHLQSDVLKRFYPDNTDFLFKTK